MLRRRPSRTMPPKIEPKPPGWLVSCLVLAIMIGLALMVVVPTLVKVVQDPRSGPLVGAIGAVGFVAVLTISLMIQRSERRQDEMAIERAGESICTFVRSFDYRQVDTWIIRAVHEELQPYWTTERRVIPIRRSDALVDILDEFDEVDLIAEFIAERCGRSLDGWLNDPRRKLPETVGDLVTFLMHQPRVPAAGMC